ncbi:transcriptional regulator, LysR family [Burkholderia ambifaria MEX-5]|uniref:Transcriptional regulator, LysR family n=1 Tax=Burkholderia ambifaria MEX-5 TaxID=396597 RepID=B1SZS2_9BURK|nr:transcriptional regulator, LysR family [Burkholderia ambifaria MEX-5]
MVRDTVRLGLGAACLPVSLVSRDLAAGTLVSWGDVPGPDIALWALYRFKAIVERARVRVSRSPRERVSVGHPQELAAYIDAQQ